MVSQTQIDEEILEAITVLRKGGVVVFPTETAYGLAADTTDTRAVQRVAAIKGRESGKTFPILVSDLATAKRYVLLSPVLEQLAERFWPGPLTIVAPAIQPSNHPAVRPCSPSVIRGGTIAIRVSSNPVACALCAGFGSPITVTSANRAGGKECYLTQDVRDQFSSQLLQPDYYLDAGALAFHSPSTIVREADGEVEVLRQGELYVPTREKIV